MGKFADLKARTEPLRVNSPQAEPLYSRAGKALGNEIADQLNILFNAPTETLADAVLVETKRSKPTDALLFNISSEMGWVDVYIDKVKLDGVSVFDEIIYGDNIKKMLNVACLTFVSKHPDLFAAYQFDGMAYAKIYINDESFDKPAPEFNFFKWLRSLFVPHKVGV